MTGLRQEIEDIKTNTREEIKLQMEFLSKIDNSISRTKKLILPHTSAETRLAIIEFLGILDDYATAKPINLDDKEPNHE